MQQDFQDIVSQFRVEGRARSTVPYGWGHIHDTYVTTCGAGTGARRYVLQRINTSVFRDPFALMENIERVTSHQRRRLVESGASDADRRAMTVVPTRGGGSLYVDPNGGVWRMYLFVEGTRVCEAAASPAEARAIARAFGMFHRQVADLSNGRLHETIPGFHDTPARVAALERAVRADAVGRAAGVSGEIAFARQHATVADLVWRRHRTGEVPERITHGDTKANNVLLDERTGEGLCVIDLDTAMPGLLPYDFGDMARSMVGGAGEDERDLARMRVRMDVFEALAAGYLGSAGGFLNAAEKELLAASCRLVTYEVGIRFLTDHLQGDTYFKVDREGHNLDRCRAQFRLAELLAEREDEMREIVRRAAG
jgi:Ser/Thr protein kinase RdoA (MazF antagonist)